MKLLPSPSTSLGYFCRRRSNFRWSWLAARDVRCMSRAAEDYADFLANQKHEAKPSHLLKTPSLPARPTFEGLGLAPKFVKSLRIAFPNVEHPTDTQARLIPATLGTQDVLLKDDTGSGKSFGLILGLLNKPRRVLRDHKSGQEAQGQFITTLLLVPHRDLAYQLYHWIERVTNAVSPSPPLPSIAQMLVRGTGIPLATQISELKRNPPHILICTPQALMDVYKQEKDALKLSTLSTVAVDEVDYLVETPARKDPNKSFRLAHEKAKKKIMAHPGPTREFLDIVFAKRKALNERRYGSEESNSEYGVKEARSNSAAPGTDEAKIPQLILSSATLRVHLKDYLFEESGWLNKDNLVKIFTEKKPRKDLTPVDKAAKVKEAAGTSSEADGKKKEMILHSVLVVSDTEIKNVDGARPAPSTTSDEFALLDEAEAEEFDADEMSSDDSLLYYQKKYEKTASPFNANALEAIAAAFALDVPSIALLVVPSSAPVHRAVYELRELGVNAHGLDLLVEGRGRRHLLDNKAGVVREDPTLLVATLATTRGLDLPELTHVFILGIPEGPKVNGRTVDGYVHIAGRVGRFGRKGKVITVVEAGEASSVLVTEADKMVRILKTIGVRPVVFENYK
ncbi:P-loop containing nucleoside triphosphate hydrolase protein [Crassisporium funariophilum]|nr:P-loop containing nucleoside triphosphate hydrolase protein [Crassisporium funariophilum]